MEKMYKLKEAAALLGVCRQTLYVWRKQGLLEFSRVGKSPRIAESDLQKLIKKEGR